MKVYKISLIVTVYLFAFSSLKLLNYNRKWLLYISRKLHRIQDDITFCKNINVKSNLPLVLKVRWGCFVLLPKFIEILFQSYWKLNFQLWYEAERWIRDWPVPSLIKWDHKWSKSWSSGFSSIYRLETCCESYTWQSC